MAPMRMPQMVKSSVGGDPACPGAEIAGQLEPRSRLVYAPESVHRKILCNSVVTDDANNPGIDLHLVPSKQRFEGFKVARRKPLQQLHLPLSIPTYWF
jgi:hypothetical protein